MATVGLSDNNSKLLSPKKRTTVAYRMLVVFSVLYFARPEDLIPGLGHIPMEKIAGGIALLALIVGASARRKSGGWPLELKLLIALFFWQCLSVPFAFYKMGALSWVFNRCSKGLIVALLVGLLLESIAQVRQLLFIQAGAVAGMTFFSILTYQGGRMGGVLGGVFDNPNDLAINIALNWPLCWMFLLFTKSPLKKVLWATAMLLMVRGLMLTYSRSGFLALAVAVIFSLWEFGLRGKRPYLIGAALFFGIALLILGPSKYGDRLKSIVSEGTDTSGADIFGGDAKQAREELLKQSLWVTATHPIFGVGAGQFQAYTGLWRVTHNTYTEISADSGIPALLLFISVLALAFRNLRRVRLSPIFAVSPEIRLYTGGLWAALASYVTGAMFASTAYTIFPYFLIAYTTALYRLSCQTAEDQYPSAGQVPLPLSSESSLASVKSI
jgi:putative inorganic carbon (hco3(-)) transporter